MRINKNLTKDVFFSSESCHVQLNLRKKLINKKIIIIQGCSTEPGSSDFNTSLGDWLLHKRAGRNGPVDTLQPIKRKMVSRVGQQEIHPHLFPPTIRQVHGKAAFFQCFLLELVDQHVRGFQLVSQPVSFRKPSHIFCEKMYKTCKYVN